jgi:nucleoside-diphosphate-sugar epimerase
MKVALTGATGFVGRAVAACLLDRDDTLRAWFRPGRALARWEQPGLEWVEGDLRHPGSNRRLVEGCAAVVHAALDRPGAGFRGAEGDLIDFVETNVVGSIRLIEDARRAGVERFVFISTCAVHEVILDDRPLDETHPLWATSHYGAHKAAIEAFVGSFGLGSGYPVCALRPSGIYGLADPPHRSKWFELVRKVVRGQPVECNRGGKEVHVSDVARAVALLLDAPTDPIVGQAFNCTDRYVSDREVAEIARTISGATGSIGGASPQPRHSISTAKIRDMGMAFGGTPLLERTVAQLVEAARPA